MDLNREKALEIKRLKIQEKRKQQKEKRQKEFERFAKKNEIARNARIAAATNILISKCNDVDKEKDTARNDSFPDINDFNDSGMCDDSRPSDTDVNIDKSHKIIQITSGDERKISDTDDILENSKDNFVVNTHSSNNSNAVNKLNKLANILRHTKNRETRLRKNIKKLKLIIEEKKKKIKFWQNKYYRLRKKINKKDQDDIIDNVKKIENKGKKAVRQQLIYSEALQKQLIERKEEMKTEYSKSFFARLVSGKIIKKYKLMKKNSVLVSTYLQRKHLNLEKPSFKRNILTNRIEIAKREVRKFLERDDNSSMSPGSKDVITKNGITVRKRFLSDTLTSLYKKYCQEGLSSISKATFFRLTPFWIITKRETDRDTTLCKAHANFDFLVTKLAKLKYLPSCSAKTVLEKFKCDIKNKNCMYNECTKCKKDFVINNNNKDQSHYFEWVTSKENREGKGGKMYHVTLTSKKKIECKVTEMIQKFNLTVPGFLKHSYDTWHQYKAVQDIESNLKLNQIKVIIDFSQNYIGKYASEIQSVHFGASKSQITLHSGVFCYRDKDNDKIKCISFCTVSECLRHDASAIWAHLQPIFLLIKKMVPQVNTIHFQSDGPSTQYKNKTNFDLFQQHCTKLRLEKASWNFTTPGHGKSKADGAGGTAKTLCDRAVHAGRDVISINDIIEVVGKSSKMHVFHVTQKDIENIDQLVRPHIKSAPKSRQIFQILWTKNKPDFLYLNYLSCTDPSCMITPPCAHFSLISNGWSLQFMTKLNTKREKIKKKTIGNVQKLKQKKRKVEENSDLEAETLADIQVLNPKKRKVSKKN